MFFVFCGFGGFSKGSLWVLLDCLVFFFRLLVFFKGLKKMIFITCCFCLFSGVFCSFWGDVLLIGLFYSLLGFLSGLLLFFCGELFCCCLLWLFFSSFLIQNCLLLFGSFWCMLIMFFLFQTLLKKCFNCFSSGCFAFFRFVFYWFVVLLFSFEVLFLVLGLRFMRFSCFFFEKSVVFECC